jgi:uncharacterized RDD family membrane protein YckC
MNLESNSPSKPKNIVTNDDMDFDFKPITSGLGFHNNKTTEIKPAFTETAALTRSQINISTPAKIARKDNQVYQNELSAFYAHETANNIPVETPTVEKIIRTATKSQRVLAYFLDFSLVLSMVGIVLTIMSRLIEKDLMEVWTTYPNEITPLVLVLFTGFYTMYFSIFEKTTQSTLGKNLLSITVVDLDNKPQSFTMLMFRSFVTLMNFVSLGLFSYFDLQNKIANTKVIKVD